MCGIFGFLNCEQRTQESLQSSLERLSHRGPDARNTFSDGEVALGHLRLSILDLSETANQPMHSHCGRYVMVYNGEVYNFREIQKEISLQNPSFQPVTQSDSEIILQSFVLWGVDFVSRLNGMFAIAIWDKLERKLFLFRDRVGIKPIYVFQKAEGLAFASELKVLMDDFYVKKQLSIDYSAVNKFLHLGYIPAPDSIFQQIRKFPQGHWGFYDQKKRNFEIFSYWNPEEKIYNHDTSLTYDEQLDELQQLVESSVKYRLISDVSLGTFLSGGIDSSLVTAVAQKIHSGPMKTFSIGFWDKDFDESGYAKKIADYLGTQHHSMHVTEADALEWLPQLTNIYDEPYADSSAIPTLLVSKMAREKVTVTLSGDGGDELFLGYGAYQWARRLAHPALPYVRKPARALLKIGPARYRRAAGLFDPLPHDQLKSHIFSQEQYFFSRKEIGRLLNPDFSQRFQLDEVFSGNPSLLPPASQQALFDLKYYLPDDLLVKVDRASMFFALETRVPLLDYRIVEWALNLDERYKLNEGQAKWMLKKLLYSYVPEEFFMRPKRGFAIPLAKWLKTDLRSFVMDYLNSQALKKTGLFDAYLVEKLVFDFYQKDQHWLYNRIWLVVLLQKWFLENTD